MNNPIDKSHVTVREGFVFCKECRYCNSAEQDLGQPQAFLGFCHKNPVVMTDVNRVVKVGDQDVSVQVGGFPTVTDNIGCFSGHKMTKEELMLDHMKSAGKRENA
jgi:hypothetical protein